LQAIIVQQPSILTGKGDKQTNKEHMRTEQNFEKIGCDQRERSTKLGKGAALLLARGAS
jgi:hypothetical protein